MESRPTNSLVIRSARLMKFLKKPSWRIFWLGFDDKNDEHGIDNGECFDCVRAFDCHTQRKWLMWMRLDILGITLWIRQDQRIPFPILVCRGFYLGRQLKTSDYKILSRILVVGSDFNVDWYFGSVIRWLIFRLQRSSNKSHSLISGFVRCAAAIINRLINYDSRKGWRIRLILQVFFVMKRMRMRAVKREQREGEWLVGLKVKERRGKRHGRIGTETESLLSILALLQSAAQKTQTQTSKSPTKARIRNDSTAQENIIQALESSGE